MRSDSTTQAAQPQGIDLRHWSGSRLSLDYTFQHERLARFYAGDPARPEAWRTAIARAQAHPRQRGAVVTLLQAQLAARQAPEQARAAVVKLGDPQTVAIVTGQQAGLFGGPLYTLMKGLTAAKLAADIEAQYRVPCVTVFWNHAEDHDWDEVASADVLDGSMALARVTVTGGEGAGRVPVGRVTLTGDVERALGELEAALPPTEFTADVRDQLRGCYRPGFGMAEAFGRLIDLLLGPLGVIVFDGSDPAAKPLAAPLFLRVIDHPGHTSQLAAAAADALVAQGYHAQVVVQKDATALFSMRAGREPLRYRDGQFLIGDTVEDGAAVRAEALAHPEHFSPNVLLRAVVQDTVFPTIAYVAGPSELAYLGQLKDVYAFHETPMPLIVPRATGTLLDSASLRFLERTGLELRTLQAQDEHVLNQWLDAQLPPTLEQALQDLGQVAADRLAALLGVVSGFDPTLEGAVKSTQGRIEHELSGLHAKIIQAAKRRHETLRRQFAHAQQLAFPGGHPQERAVSLAWYMNRFGPALVPRLYDALPLESGKHWLLQI
ncbi:MAG: bacillithiol biosynthesis cysteine-adding enzyme BshC [Acidobacteria bacterium]|nr:bacillithiol biosynthesis cysteine-adding enzyme BshC [Acidobacteriota bacterium]